MSRSFGRRLYAKTCVYAGCGQPFQAVDATQGACSASCAAKHRIARDGRGALDPATRQPPYAPEPAAYVERLLAQVRARRLAHERRTGRRTYRIETGWMQRPGAGAQNVGADDMDGWGYR